ncbi:MAG: FAD-dependent oxidoreductase [Oscillospiraceae bacterium]
MKKLEADVVVIAAGASGLAAACAAAEKGASVIVFEKGATTGGAANMGMGFFAAGSKIQDEQMIDFTPDDAFKLFMEYTHWRVNARLVRKYVDMSASTVEWIRDMGVEFLGAFKYFKTSKATWHIVKAPGTNKIAERSASYMLKRMTEHAKELGVEFYLRTPVKKILMENGHVVGVLAQSEDGEEYEAYCSCVIVCTGGMGDSPEMVKKYIGYTWGEDLFSFRIPGITGDGLRMVWDAGGAKSPMTMELTYCCPELNNLFTTLQETMKQANLMVNLDGQRFMNEEVLNITPFTGNALSLQRENKGFTIITDEILDDYAKNGLDFIHYHFGIHGTERWQSELEAYRRGDIVEAGGLAELQKVMNTTKSFFEADSLEDLCAQTGIKLKNLEKTIEEYNAMCGTVDRQFCKNHKYMRPIKGKKYYAAMWLPSGYGTLGGIRTNDKMEVLTEEGFKIPGLYAAGIDANTIYADTYLFYMPGNTMGFALNSGRMAGYNAVDYIDSDEFVE